jgi:hypothetical protein
VGVAQDQLAATDAEISRLAACTSLSASDSFTTDSSARQGRPVLTRPVTPNAWSLAGPALGRISAQGGVVSGYRTLPGPATVSGCQVAVPLMAQ